MWHAFGNLGHWSEWHFLAPSMRSALYGSMAKIKAFGYAYIETPKGDLCWYVSHSDLNPRRRFTLGPYKPLQSDLGVGEP